MKLIVLNPVTKLPEPTPESLLIPEFLEIWTRKNKIDGDRLGEGKKRNLQEFGYIYFMGVYDSRFKWLQDPKVKLAKIIEILKLPPDWTPDPLVLAATKAFQETQITPSTEIVNSILGVNMDLASWVKTKRTAMAGGTSNAKEVSEILDIVDRASSIVESIKRAQASLEKEYDNSATGRKGRKLGLFELPEEREGGL